MDCKQSQSNLSDYREQNIITNHHQHVRPVVVAVTLYRFAYMLTALGEPGRLQGAQKGTRHQKATTVFHRTITPNIS